MDGFLIFCFLQIWIVFIKADTCTWENCPKWDHNLINIHFVPHTHDDMGWNKKVDDYYTGVHQDINTHVGVQYIINTVLQELNMDPTRKFSYCETGYLTRWMEDHPNLVNNTLVKFVQSGQLEFIGGGWTQPDEAATHYVELVDMYTLGLGILNDRFGRCGRPTTAWQIDPFGHSREHANLVRSMGYNSLFFAREHYLEHAARIANASIQMQWHTSDDNNNTILTGAFWGYYCTPNGFDFEGTFHKSEPIVDNPMFEDVNAQARSDEFMQYINQRNGSQLHNHYLVLMGCDFTFGNANMMFTNIDKLINNLNKFYAGKVVAFYSTPTCYTTAVNELTSIKWPDKYDDFFPYANGDHRYWTGYFTSKPAMKGLVRKSTALLQLTRQLSALALNTWSDQTKTQIQIFERAVSLSMHHDAITGTSKEAVTQDYEYRLTKGWTKAEQVLIASMQSISQRLKQNSLVLPAQLICRNINESECLYTQANNQFMVTVHNANGQNLSTVVRFPLYQFDRSLSIADANGNSVSYQIIDTFNNSAQINNSNIATYEVAFVANVRPLGFHTYFVTLPGSKEKPLASPKKLSRLIKKDSSTISNGLIQLTFDSNGYLSQLTDLTMSKSYAIKQEFLYYIGYPGNQTGQQPSGAYVFRPYNGSIGFTGPITLTMVQGSLVNEVRQIVTPWVSQVIRLLPNKTYVEFEWTIGPVDVSDGAGKEVITRYTVNGLNTNGVYYTDANGRQLMKRTRNFANSYQYLNTEPIAANYYPINSRVLLTDGTTSMAILTDRSHGGGSLVDGQVEIMLHRRDLFDDDFGVAEPLNEPGRDGRGLVIRGKHWLIIGSASSIPQRHRSLAYEMLHSPVLTFATYASNTTYQQNFASEYSGLSQPLPPNVNLVTLKQLDASNVLLRLEHFYQKNEDPTLSQPITVDLSLLFPDFNISQIQTLSLAANNVTGSLTGTTVTLNPMDIKAYQLTVNVASNNQISTTTHSVVDRNGNTRSGGSVLLWILCSMLLWILF